MAKPRPTFTKRQRERKKQEKRAEKARRRDERKAAREDRRTTATEVGGEDPDIAGIIPGPQAQPWMEDGDNDEKSEAE